MFLAFPSLLTVLNREHILCKRSHVLAVLNFTPAVWFRAVATDDTTWHAYPCQGMRCLASFTVPQFHYSRVCTGCRWLQRVPRIPLCLLCSSWSKFSLGAVYLKETSRGSEVQCRMGRVIIEQWIVQDVAGSGRDLILSIACGGKPQKLQTASEATF